MLYKACYTDLFQSSKAKIKTKNIKVMLKDQASGFVICAVLSKRDYWLL